MPYYYRIKIKDFNEVYFRDLLRILNVTDDKLNAILMKGKDGYEIFTKRPFTIIEKNFLFICTHDIKENRQIKEKLQKENYG